MNDIEGHVRRVESDLASMNRNGGDRGAGNRMSEPGERRRQIG